MRILFLTSILLNFFLCSNAQNVVGNFPELLSTIDHFVFKEGSFKTTKQFQDTHNMVSHSYGYQTFNALEIEGAYYNAHAQNGKIVAFHNSFIAKELLVCKHAHSLSKETILANFLESNQEQFTNVPKLENIIWKELSENQFEIDNQALSVEKIRFKKTYIYTNEGLEPSWSFSFLLPNENHWYYTIVNAATGEIIKQFDWILTCDINHNHSTHSLGESIDHCETNNILAQKKGDGAKYNSFAIGVESPIHGSRSMLIDPANALASPYGWHDTDATRGADFTITRGNNVWAREDRDNNNYEGYSPDGGSNLTFDFPFATSASADDNLDAAITNIFVWNNFMHDVWYHYGFNEESGNFQANNLGRATEGAGDFVFADAQDGSGTNNANFATPEDGLNPRMQMYLWGTIGNLGINVFSPSNMEGTYAASGADFGPKLSDPIKAQLVVVNDGTSTPTYGCTTLTNAADIKGKIALIERGTCTFVEKVRNAQNAGAIAVVIYTDSRAVIEMGSDGTQNDITIPSIMIQRSLGLSLKNEAAIKTFEVAIYDSSDGGSFDSDFDNGVIAHEYTHGISTRLTGGALNSNCLRNQEQMGEGWSDFFSLVMTQKKDDKGSDLRGIGTYLMNQPTTGSGIRPYPYSTDTSASPYTYQDIAQLSIPHGIGAVWCAMLWDMYWAFIDEYGYDPDIYEGTGGNNICMQLVIDGMKLQPCGPGFIDARDAILLADKLNNVGKNEKLIWTAFTNRGLGWDADGGDPNNRLDGKNGFKLPPKFRGFVGISKIAIDKVTEDQSIEYNIVIENLSDKTYTNVVVTDTIPDLLIFDPNSTECDWVVNNNILSLTIAEMEPGSSLECQYSCKPKGGAYTSTLLTDGAEEKGDKWNTTTDLGTNAWTLQSAVVAEGKSCWFISNLSGQTDQSLIYNIGLVKKGQVLSFQHYYNTDSGRDGGVVEFSNDGGTTWLDAEMYFMSNGYNAFIANNTSTTLNTRSLFSGKSNGFITSQIILDAFTGENVSVRFRFATDRFFSGIGWYIDDLKLQNFVAVTNVIWGNNNGNTMGAKVTTVIYDTDESNSIETPNNAAFGAWVYPNPTNNYVHILLNETIESATVYITDLTGKELYRNGLKMGNNSINIQSFASGTYLITIEYNGTTEKHPLVKI